MFIVSLTKQGIGWMLVCDSIELTIYKYFFCFLRTTFSRHSFIKYIQHKMLDILREEHLSLMKFICFPGAHTCHLSKELN